MVKISVSSSSLLLLLALAAANSVSGFVVHPQEQKNTALKVVDEETDFDAPTERAMAVGNVVTSKPAPMTIGFGGLGTVQVPSFIANAFEGADETTTATPTDVDAIMALDDECYLGKDGDLEECADFDPVSP